MNEHSDNWTDGFETVEIARDFAYEPQATCEPRYLPVVGLYDNDEKTRVDLPCLFAAVNAASDREKQTKGST